MSHVLSCSVSECSYNRNHECHAAAIAVGADHPVCDTFTRASAAMDEGAMPEVSRCAVAECKFNQSMDCEAPGITVGTHMDHADCATFVPKM